MAKGVVDHQNKWNTYANHLLRGLAASSL